MSHFTTIQTQIRDLDALRDACGDLSLGFTANTKCRGYAGVTRLAQQLLSHEGDARLVQGYRKGHLLRVGQRDLHAGNIARADVPNHAKCARGDASGSSNTFPVLT